MKALRNVRNSIRGLEVLDAPDVFLAGGLLSCSGTAPLDVTWRLGAPRFATWYRNDRKLEVKR